jgi:hypothetical protein
MARLKRKSETLESARRRLAGIQQISPKPDFGPGLSLEAYEAEIEGFIDDQNAYNGDIAALDERANQLDTRERRLADFNQRILAAVKAQFGPDSNEFELAGGVRRSDRKKPVRKQKAPAGA